MPVGESGGAKGNGLRGEPAARSRRGAEAEEAGRKLVALRWWAGPKARQGGLKAASAAKGLYCGPCAT